MEDTQPPDTSAPGAHSMAPHPPLLPEPLTPAASADSEGQIATDNMVAEAGNEPGHTSQLCGTNQLTDPSAPAVAAPGMMECAGSLYVRAVKVDLTKPECLRVVSHHIRVTQLATAALRPSERARSRKVNYPYSPTRATCRVGGVLGRFRGRYEM